MIFETKVKYKLFGFIPVRRKIGFTFKMETWMLLSDYTQMAPLDFGFMEESSFLIKTCYCAARLWYLEHGKKVMFNEDHVKKWIENMKTIDSKELIETLLKSKIGGESIEELIPKVIQAEEEVKKKLHGMKLQTTQ